MVDIAEPSLLAQASCTAALPLAPQFPVKTHPLPLSGLTGALSQVLARLLSRVWKCPRRQEASRRF